MKIQTLEAEWDQTPRAVELNWDQLVQVLTGAPTATFDHKAWQPADLLVPGQRGDVNVATLQLLVLDFDKLRASEWIDVLKSLEGISHCWHSTRSHAPVDGALRYRVAVQLSRPVLATHWLAFWSLCVEMFGSSTADESCKDPARVYFQPCLNDYPFESGQGDGACLPVDQILEHARRSATAKDLSLPDTLAVIAKGKPYGEFQECGRDTLLALLAGRTDYAAPGERDKSIYAMARFVASRARDRVDPDAVADLFTETVDASILENPGSTTSSVLRYKLAKAWEDVSIALAGEDPIRMAQMCRSGPYTEEETSRWADMHGLSSAAELSAQLVVKHLGDLYALSDGNYVYSGSELSGQDLVRQGLTLCQGGGLGVVLTEIDPKTSRQKDVPWKYLKRRHCFEVRHLKMSLSIPHSYVQRPDTLCLAVRPRRPDLVPAYDPAIEEWLASWGDDTLLDWLATCPRLDKATSALFLHGAPKSGKDMLANAIAAIWGKRPTSLEDISETWSDALTECPVVFANESLPVRYRRDSGLIRRLITSVAVSVNQKYRNTSKMEGSVRVVIAKNNLTLFEGRESMSSDDVLAICERLLYYRMHNRAPFFAPDRFAQHILWLEDTRGADARSRSADRLWVEGRDSPLHRAMRVSSRDRSLVCQWLMAFIKRPVIIGDLAGTGWATNNGKLRINPTIIYDRWDAYLSKERQLGLDAICQVAREIGTQGNRDMYLINLEDLVQWGEANSNSCTVRELEIWLAQANDMSEKRVN